MINKERTELLQDLANEIVQALRNSEEILLLFVCTHNSRRSQAAEYWARHYCKQYALENIKVASAGTEVTRFYPEMIKAINRVDPCLKINECGVENQIIVDSSSEPAAQMFSKQYNDESLQHEHIVAVMVCDSANEHCPIIPNATTRVPLTFKDPKYADGTDQVQEAYDTCVKQIGDDLDVVFANVTAAINT